MVLVCGSRGWDDPEQIRARIAELPAHTVIVHGGARGADRMADKAAKELGFPVVEIPADCKSLGRSAGLQRNLQMLDLGPDLVIAFWRHESAGTGHTIREAKTRGIPVEVVTT